MVSVWGFLWRRPGVPLFSFRGIVVEAHWSIVFIVFTWGGFLASSRFLGRYPGLSTTTITVMILVSLVLLELSIVLHEFGHSFASRREGLVADRITLWGLGGLSWSSGRRSPGSEFRIVLAGPAVSVALAMVFGGVGWLLHRVGAPDAVVGVVVLFSQLNAVFVVYNLIPMVPLDGGQLLHSGLWRWRGLKFAYEWASGIGLAIACTVLGFGAAAPFIGLNDQVAGRGYPIGFTFLIQGAIMLYMTMQYRTAYRPRPGPVRRLVVVGDLAPTNGARAPVARDLSVAAYLAASTDASTYGTVASPVVEDGRTVGVISRGLASLVPADKREETTVGQVMLSPKDAVVLKRETPVTPAFNALQAGTGRGVIMERKAVAAIILASNCADIILRAKDQSRGAAPASPPSQMGRR